MHKKLEQRRHRLERGKPMNALAIDCAVSRLAVAAKSGSTFAKITIDAGTRQSEKLLLAIDTVMKEAGIAPSELDCTAVTQGPGTFTGLRLGLSALKAIQLAHGVPLYAVPSLKAYAWPFRKFRETVLSVIQAKEDEYFYAFYMHGEQIRAEESMDIEGILRQLDPEIPILTCGPAASQFTGRARELFPLCPAYDISPESGCCESLLEIAELMLREKTPPLNDYDGPLYVKKSEAEIALASGTKRKEL